MKIIQNNSLKSGLGLFRNILPSVSSVAMTFVPTNIAGLLAWYDPTDASSLLFGAGVSQINDKSSNGFHLTQATGTNQPLSVTDPTLNKPVLSMNGNQYVFRTGISMAQSAFTCITAMMAKTGTGGARGFTMAPAGGNDTVAAGFCSDRNITGPDQITTTTTTALAVANAITLDSWFIHSSDRNATALRGAINGNAMASTVISTALGTMVMFALGINISNPPALGSGKLTGSWGGTLLYSGILPDTDRQKVEGWLAWTLNLQGTLVAGHPYKNTPPMSSSLANAVTWNGVQGQWSGVDGTWT